MIQLSSVMDLPALSLDEGRITGTVKDVLIDAGQRMVAYLVIQSPHWFQGPMAVPMDKVTGIGAQAVVLTSEQYVQPLGEQERAVRLALIHVRLPGSKLYTPQGEQIGEVEDASMGSDGRILELKLVDGRTIPARQVLTFGPNIVMASPEELEPLKVLRPAAEEIDLGGAPDAQSTEDAESVPVRLHTPAQPEEATHADAEPLQRQEGFLVGRRLSHDIQGTVGLIGRAGETVTRDMVRAARQAGKLVELTTHTVAG